MSYLSIRRVVSRRDHTHHETIRSEFLSDGGFKSDEEAARYVKIMAYLRDRKLEVRPGPRKGRSSMKDGDIITCRKCGGVGELKTKVDYNGVSLTSNDVETSSTTTLKQEMIKTRCKVCKGQGKVKVSLKYLPIEKEAS
jgi:hypothetical protein